MTKQLTEQQSDKNTNSRLFITPENTREIVAMLHQTVSQHTKEIFVLNQYLSNTMEDNEDISFKELMKAIKNEDGRKIIANYGLDPKLGKYHRTYCEACEKRIEGEAPVTKCDTCDSKNITMGVLDRIEIIKDKNETKSPIFRPPYNYQIPLSFIPGLGKKTIEKLLNTFETEMNILHKLSFDDIEAVCGEKIAKNIIDAKMGNIQIAAGGGGVYGKVTTNKQEEL